MKKWIVINNPKKPELKQYKYELSVKETLAFDEFKKEAHQKLLEHQINTYKGSDRDEEYRHNTINWTSAYNVGGLYSIEFIPTSIGTIIKAHCKRLNLEKDLTDYDIW